MYYGGLCILYACVYVLRRIRYFISVWLYISVDSVYGSLSLNVFHQIISIYMICMVCSIHIYCAGKVIIKCHVANYKCFFVMYIIIICSYSLLYTLTSFFI